MLLRDPSLLNSHSPSSTHVRRDDVTEVTLKIRPDPYCESDKRAHFQWFYFRSSGFQHLPVGHTVRYILANAGEASFAPAWNDYKVVYSANREDWRRVQATSYQDGKLVFEHTVGEDGELGAASQLYFSYFAPYSYERHMELVAK